MNIYKTERVPQAQPIPWENTPYSTPIPENLWNVGQIGLSIEHALRTDSSSLHEITKHLADADLIQLPDASVSINYPYKMPPTVYTPGCMNTIEEEQNRLLKNFASNAYTALTKRFIDLPWNNWFIAPSFLEGDDTNSTISLGVYVDEYFLKTVVE